MSRPTTFNLADLWEGVADSVPEREALVCGTQRLTYAELDERANRLGHALTERGVGPGDHVAIYLQNCAEYMETMLGCFKIRAVPINVNYRYVERELQYLLDDSDSVFVVAGAEFEARLAAVQGELPALKGGLRVGPAEVDGGLLTPYDDALASASGERTFDARSNDDHFIMYTGGTTGMPKGVIWRHEDAFFACLLGGDATQMQGPVAEPAEVIDRIGAQPGVMLSAAPLMHAAGQWPAFIYWFTGSAYHLLSGPFDPVNMWQIIEREKVNMATVVGDAMARPLLDAWDEHGPFDISNLFAISNGGAVMSATIKKRFASTFPNLFLRDGYGSSETGAQAGIDEKTTKGGLGSFSSYDDETTVLDENLDPIAPGSGQTGMVARRGHVPIGYYNDPEKTAKTFFEKDGERWVMPGDMATVDEDGSIRLLGRGSVSINTGGEKVYPEEVESALKAHPCVYDTVVVGVPDERWGEAVTAVVQLSPGHDFDREAVNEAARESIAGYKAPKNYVVVDQIVRSPSGKPDYRWAKETAVARLA